MVQFDVELILARQLAEYLATPVFLVEPAGTLLFYNEPAERILGRRFEETGALSASEWTTIFIPEDVQGRPLPPEALPLSIAIAERRPVHGDFWIQGLDGVRHHIEVTAFPLVGTAGHFVGGVAIFWEADE
jgi:PAS domain-containing protein